MRRRLGILLTMLGALSFCLGLVQPPSSAQTGPSLTITPAADLIDPLGDGQFALAQWQGMPPGQPVYLRQCTAHPRSVKQCSQTGLLGPGLITAGVSDDQGGGRIVFQIRVGLVNSDAVGDATKISFPCDYRHLCSIALFLDGAASNVGTAVLVPIRFGFPPDACPAGGGDYLTGSGSSAVFRAMLDWESTVCRPPTNVLAQYILQSGEEGRSSFAEGLVDFAVTGFPLTKKQNDQLNAAHVRFGYAPVSLSGLTFGFRLFDRVTGQQVTDLRLTPELLAEIFTGQLRTWNDPRILDLNPGHVDADGVGTLPTKLKAVVQGDASDSTLELTSWFWDVTRDTWELGNQQLPAASGDPFSKGPTSIFPSTGAVSLFTGSRAVAREVAKPSQDVSPDFGYIGAMDSSWAELYGLPTARIQNPAGTFVAPTPEAFLAAVPDMAVNDDGVTRTPNHASTIPDAYPLPTLQYAIVRHSRIDTPFDHFGGADGTNLKRFLGYAVGAGQRHLPEGYAPLPPTLARLTTAALKDVPTGPDPVVVHSTPPPSSETPSPAYSPPAETPPVIPPPDTGGPTPPPSEPGSKPVPIERGPFVPASALGEGTSQRAIPMLFAFGAAGLVVGPGLALTDVRSRRKVRKPGRSRRRLHLGRRRP